MSRVYELPFRVASVTTARTLMYVTAGSYSLRLKRAWVTQETGTGEQLCVGIGRITSAGIPTSTTVTALIPTRSLPSAGFTVEANVTASEPTYGSKTAGVAMVGWYGVQGFLSSIGYYWFDDSSGASITIPPGEAYGLYLMNNPTTGLALAFGMVIDELYG